MHKLIRAGIAAALAASTASAFAQHGTYEANRRISGPDGRFEIRYILRLTNRDASLTTEVVSGRPSWNNDLLRRNGEIIRRLDDRRSIIQSGDWRAGTPIQLRFTKLDGDFKVANYKAELDRDRLEITELDERLYGTERIRLQKTRSDDTGSSDDREFVGRYELERTWHASNRDDIVFGYQLELSRNGDARLDITNTGKGVPHGTELDPMGVIIAKMVRGRIRLDGDWKSRDGRLDINWTRIGGDRTSTRMILELQRGALRATSYDRRQFADKPFELSSTGLIRQRYKIEGGRPIEPGRPDPGRPVDPGKPVFRPADRERAIGEFNQIYPREGNWEVQRLLMVFPNGTVMFTSQVNGRGAYDKTVNTNKYGNIFNRLQNERKHVVHRGSWTIERDELVLDLDEVDNSPLKVTLRFRFTDKEAYLVSGNRNWYGSAEMRLRKQ